jgi:hypothetical protein
MFQLLAFEQQRPHKAMLFRDAQRALEVIVDLALGSIERDRKASAEQASLELVARPAAAERVEAGVGALQLTVRERYAGKDKLAPRAHWHCRKYFFRLSTCPEKQVEACFCRTYA